MKNYQIAVHIPHDGTLFPPELMDSVCVSQELFEKHNSVMRDYGVTQLVPDEYRQNIVSFEVSRLLCDVERFLGNEEIMEQYGMGFCYSHSYDGTKIKNVDDELRARTLKYYLAHHSKLDNIAANCKSLFLIDLHSFSETIVPHSQLDSKRPLPDICIGTDEVYTSADTVSALLQFIGSEGMTAELNYPYSGSIIPNAVMNHESDCKYSTVMIEINKACYLDEEGCIIASSAEKIKRIIGDLLDWVQSK